MTMTRMMMMSRCGRPHQRRVNSAFSIVHPPLCEPRRGFSAWFEDDYRHSAPRASSSGRDEDKSVAVFKINADYLEKSSVVIDQKAMGIPFHIVDEAEVMKRVEAHHGTPDIEVHSAERLLLPFWLTRTAAAGTFKAELLQKDPAYMTQQHCYVWVEGPRYEFSYPFDEYVTFNQTCACYTEPLSLVESCVRGTHVPSMLISRFELLQDLEERLRGEKRRIPLRLIPFTMSTTTALALVEKRVSRTVVMRRIEKELKKFHGHFIQSNLTLTALSLHASNIRPVFLPMYKIIITTSTNRHTPLPVYVCGATGKTVGPVLHASTTQRALWMGGCGAAAFTAAALSGASSLPLTVTIGAGAAVLGSRLARLYYYMQFKRQNALWMSELQRAGLLNLPSDESGYRWTPEQEEKQEYEYREELRHEARRRASFQQRVKEESERESAHKYGRHVDARHRRRTDLQNVDPLGYYAILGLQGKEMTCTAADIQRAFRQAVRVHHPDVRQHTVQNNNNKESEAHVVDSKEGGEESTGTEYMQRLIEAYKTLSQAASKKAYDCGEMVNREQQQQQQ